MPLDEAFSSHRPIGGPAAWRGPAIAAARDWEYRLSPADIEDIAAALAVAKASGRAASAIGRAEFPLPHFGETLAGLLAGLRGGRGFLLLRGLPVDRFSEIEREVIFFGLGAHLGRAVSQNAHGELLGYVFDQGRTHAMANTRGYQTKADLTFHTDRCDLVGLLCHRAAKQGGESSVVSTAAIHDEILRTRPDLLPLLYRGFHYGEREAADSADGVSARRIPVFSERDGVVSCRFISRAIELAWKRGVPASPAEVEALELMKHYTEHPDFRLDMVLEAGDMQFCNNYVTAHARTAFEDFPEPERRRLMVRLWLSFRDPWPLASDFGEHEGIPFRPEAGPAPAPPPRQG
ncbi:TauD/TfdA family dioxygenase [Roseomonas sp. GC11]|uniref:TauD/TfdA family dioxygenase n=1 Tax=Roseomonas sp. GC11 TaxID=2950546 RepID=UPI00210E1684|nr:TauD/TfdA family dioxygenase [Roseomonas sp. GC11]MCQ4159118.1 TauD/TfdA family dioxygenase [Roseomonas sp. GC11]